MNDDTNQGADGATDAAADAKATSDQTPSTGTTANSATETNSTDTTSAKADEPPAAQGTTSDTAGSIVDKTLSEIKDDADKLGGEVGKAAEVLVDKNVRHPAHTILDELEQHLSQFDTYAVAALHGFLNRLRQAI